MNSCPLLLQIPLEQDGRLGRRLAGLSVGVIAARRGEGGVRPSGRGNAHAKGLSLLLLDGRWGCHGLQGL
jgi:hypothetical protein